MFANQPQPSTRRALLRTNALRHQSSSMQAWAAPICDIVRAAPRGQFDADALRAVYAADAVFDDPCGTIRTPKGIVRGFELIHWLCVVDVEPTDDEKMAGYLSTIESGEASDDESIKAKEAAVLALSALYAKRRESEKLAALLVTLRPLFAAIPKAKTAKLVRRDGMRTGPVTLPQVVPSPTRYHSSVASP